MKNKTIAIVLSGGKGKRMGTTVSKQYLMLKNRPILSYALESFEKSNIDEIILVVGSGDKEFVQHGIVNKYNIKKVKAIVEGGNERYNSVYNALVYIDRMMSEVSLDNTYVLVHDGARPFISVSDINIIIEEVIKEKACVLGVKAKDTIKLSTDNNYVESTPDRSNVWQIQTPQAFQFKILKSSYDKIIDDNIKNMTDDSMVVETVSDIKIKLLEGSYTNIKITTPEDLIIGETLIK
ncbi:MAG: 2-C-methyl-D-erythritol 4-phosphate cytidylyltransferase [Lachnospiraceae bacterium]|nr:2-C-methyl-D-erythritol 4-phosphate cytidylyltransferase [Lachnospiraceae bacterium]MDE6698167.1 2-C-methyl-D-erythritol 4-phosphate cytidylyltransferase [Lachnospiraceae bacterium]